MMYEDYIKEGYVSLSGLFEDIQMLAGYFGILYGQELLIKNISSKYNAYKYEEGTFLGIYEYEGTIREARLKTTTFLRNRGMCEDSIKKFLQEIEISKDYEFVRVPLSELYNNTSISSCMSRKGSWFKTLEPFGIGISARLDGNEVGRAIVWENIEGLPTDCNGFMDRIYPSDNHKIVKVFKDYANKQNFLSKKEQSYSNHALEFKGKEVTPPLCFDYNDTEERLPWLDTFKWYDISLECIHIGQYSCAVMIQSTNGTMLEGSTCPKCGCVCNEDDLCYSECAGESMCSECYNDTHICCQCCSDVFHVDAMLSVDGGVVCERCRERHYVYSEYHSDYIGINDAIYCEEEEDYILERENYYYSDLSERYSHSTETVVVIMEDGSTQNWFEYEAENNAYKYDGVYYEIEREENEAS